MNILSFVHFIAAAIVGFMTIVLVSFRSKDHSAVLWLYGLYCKKLKRWYYAPWMENAVYHLSPGNVIIRQHKCTRKTVLVFYHTDKGLILLGTAKTISKKQLIQMIKKELVGINRKLRQVINAMAIPGDSSGSSWPER